jgi:hypothetical protein
MHNPLDGLPNRALLDTNVLLDATFVNGLARAAVMQLLSSKISAIVDERTWEEARIILARIRARIDLGFDPFPYVEKFAAQVGVISVPPAPAVVKTGVPATPHLSWNARQSVSRPDCLGMCFFRLKSPAHLFQCAIFSDECR